VRNPGSIEQHGHDRRGGGKGGTGLVANHASGHGRPELRGEQHGGILIHRAEEKLPAVTPLEEERLGLLASTLGDRT
jgi:hypothetical protein